MFEQDLQLSTSNMGKRATMFLVYSPVSAAICLQPNCANTNIYPPQPSDNQLHLIKSHVEIGFTRTAFIRPFLVSLC